MIKMKRLALVIIFIAATLSCPAAVSDSAQVHVSISTTMGDIVVALYNETPKHRDNFVKLVNSGYYDGLLFHRVIEDFMIQGGDPDSRSAEPGKLLGKGGPGYTIPAEICFPIRFHKRGALAAAREGDDVNPEMRSSGSQFYIVWGKQLSPSQTDELRESWNEQTEGQFTLPDSVAETYETLGGTPHLDGAYTVFGEVVSGLDVVKKIQGVITDKHDRPKTDVRIIKAQVVKP